LDNIMASQRHDAAYMTGPMPEQSDILSWSGPGVSESWSTSHSTRQKIQNKADPIRQFLVWMTWAWHSVFPGTLAACFSILHLYLKLKVSQVRVTTEPPPWAESKGTLATVVLLFCNSPKVFHHAYFKHSLLIPTSQWLVQTHLLGSPLFTTVTVTLYSGQSFSHFQQLFRSFLSVSCSYWQLGNSFAYR
jgi:hypothetical protein